jgi:hypothetical protein
LLIRLAQALGTRTGATVRFVHSVPGEEAESQEALKIQFERY